MPDFFSLSADSIKINKKLEINYKTYPAIKIGRLAVHKYFQNIQIGSITIDWIVSLCLELRRYRYQIYINRCIQS